MNIPFDPAQVFIGGQWRAPASGTYIDLFNPSTGEGIGQIARANTHDVDAAVAAAQAALTGAWGLMSAMERGRVLSRIGEAVLKHADTLAELEALDVGKPLGQARNDVQALARYMEFYGGAADKIHGDSIPYQRDYTVYTLREPLGVTGHIIPWNYPMQIIGRSLGAALTMGNACVLKPSEEACLTALYFARIAHEAGLPAGALNVVPGTGEEAGAALCRHQDVAHISFTGSVAAGAKVQAAAAAHVAPVTLELGGKSPQLVFADADLDRALPYLLNAGIQNAGQTCSAASRILVERKIYDDVLARLSARYRALKAGPAMDDLDVGPLISARQLARVQGFLDMANQDGITIAARGEIMACAPKGGHYLRPALLADVPPAHVLAQDEIFGPVQMVMPFENEAEAVVLANGTAFGLVAGVWTSDGARQMRLAKSLRAGQVFINNYGAGGGVELPFGGVGRSGHGREKGFAALYGFSTLKTIAAYHGEADATEG
jgi:aldehyde dehydrogenase (NAD+)